MNLNNKNASLKRNALLYLFMFSALASFGLFPSAYADTHEDMNISDSSLHPGGLIALAENILIATDLCEKGKLLYKNGDYINARLKFQQALLRDPGNKNAKKFLELCDKHKHKKVRKKRRKSRKLLKKSGDFAKKKDEDKEEKLDNEDIAFLEEIEKRIVSLEMGEIPEYHSQPLPEKLLVKVKPEKITPQPSQPEEKSEDIAWAKELKEMKKSEVLVKQGDEFYSQGMYNKAYICYRKAFKIFNESK